MGNSASGKFSVGGHDVNFKTGKDDLLGEGAFGKVYAGKLSDGTDVAVKIIDRKKFKSDQDLKDMRAEVDMMTRVRGHPNVVNFIGHVEDKDRFVIVLERATGGEVMTRITQLVDAGLRFSEKVASQMFKQMLAAVKHCHDKGVVHRDLKPENFLYATPLAAGEAEGRVPIKLTDFGLSGVVTPESPFLYDVCGSAFYIAPEILTYLSEVDASVPPPMRGVRNPADRPIGHSTPVDMFALGVILHIFLSGGIPFGHHTQPENAILQAIKTQPLSFAEAKWTSISPAAKELLAGLLDKDPSKRYTADQALAHPWVSTEGAAPDTPLGAKVLEALTQYNAGNVFKRAAVAKVAQLLTADDVRGLRETFAKMDKDGSGTLTTAEIREALASVAGAKGVDAKSMMAAIDADGSGKVSWEEFLHASLEAQMLNYQTQIWAAFCEMDKDGSGTITAEELRTVLKGESEAQIARYMEEYDLDKDGTINYEEFLKMLLPKGLRYKVAKTVDVPPATGAAGAAGGAGAAP